LVQLGNGVQEQVMVDPERGPLVYDQFGDLKAMDMTDNGWHFNRIVCSDRAAYNKPWRSKGATEKKILLDIAARKNRKLAEWQEADGSARGGVRGGAPGGVPEFVQRLQAQSWSAEEQNRFFEEMSTLPQEDLDEFGKSPVLVVFYSGGVSKQQGFELVRDFIQTARAKGLTNQVVLHHPDGYDLDGEGTEPWPRYIDRLIEEIDSEPSRSGRPLLLWGHSKGATPALSLATRLQDRVLKVYCVASGAPVPGEASPFQKMAEQFKQGTDLDLLRWFCSLNADRALHAMVEAVEKGELTVDSSPYLKGKLDLMKKQYVNAIFPDMERDCKVIPAPLMAVWPKLDASSPETSMRAWRRWTSGEFTLRSVAAGHMDCLRTAEHHDHVAVDMVRVVKESQSR